MTYHKWFLQMAPFLAINVMLVVTFPIESIYLDRQAGPAAVVANQLAQWVFLPLLVFCFGLVQPISWSISHSVRARRVSAFRAVISRSGRVRLCGLVMPYAAATVIVPGFIAAALYLAADPLAVALTDDSTVRAEVAAILRWRAPGLVFGTLAALGDYVCFGIGLPAFGVVVVMTEALVFCGFLGIAGGALAVAGLSASEVTALGMLAKFLSTVALYSVVFVRRGWVRCLQLADLRGVPAVVGQGSGNGLILFNGDASRAVATPLVGHLSPFSGTVVTFCDRFYQVFGAFAASERQVLFASGRSGNKIVQLAWLTLGYAAITYVVLVAAAAPLYGTALSLLSTGTELGPALALPLLLRLAGGLAEIAAAALLTAAVILQGGRRVAAATRVSLIANWLVWLPAVYLVAGGPGLTPARLAALAIALPVLQCSLIVLVVPALRPWTAGERAAPKPEPCPSVQG
jgi:hypothetical protein